MVFSCSERLAVNKQGISFVNEGSTNLSKILLIDDDNEMTDTIKEVLEASGHVIDAANSIEEADELLAGFRYELIVLDWVMPRMTGVEYLRNIRMRNVSSPVLMLTGMKLVDNKVEGLNSGADDYLTKPFDMRELVSRVQALLRRPQAVAETELRLSGVTLNSRTLEVFWNGTELKLTKKEYQLLEVLMRNKNTVLNHETLFQKAWSSYSEASVDNVRVVMSRLRTKFGDSSCPCPVETLHGKGYVFVSKDH